MRKDEMKMIAHQAIGMNLPPVFWADLAQGREEETPVTVLLKDGLASIATVHRVIDRSRKLASDLAQHEPTFSETLSVSITLNSEDF